MYKEYAAYYDQFYQSKDYSKESLFLNALLSRHQAKTILDVGCGTGTHLSMLEQCNYICHGIDLNSEMLSIAQSKVKGNITQADMRHFNLQCQFDAIISLFAVFNHNLNSDDGLQTLRQLKKHLNPGGILLLDLYNPQSSGKKSNTLNGITRIMEWNINHETQTCDSIVKFITEDKTVEENFSLKIYSISEIKNLLEAAGFSTVIFYDNFTFEQGTPLSKNLLVCAAKLKS